MAFFLHARTGILLLKEKWEEKMSNTKDKEKEDNIKEKNKDLSYKLQSNIESSIHI